MGSHARGRMRRVFPLKAQRAESRRTNFTDENAQEEEEEREEEEEARSQIVVFEYISICI